MLNISPRSARAGALKSFYIMTIKSIERALRDEKHVILCRAGRGYYHLYRDAICVGYMYSHLTDWGGVRCILTLRISMLILRII